MAEYERIVDSGCDLISRWGLTPEAAQKAQMIALHAEGVLGMGRAYIISGRRTPDEQQQLSQQGKGPSTGSRHLLGEAFDMGWDFDPDPAALITLGAFAKCIGLRWGGDFSDYPNPNHFDLGV